MTAPAYQQVASVAPRTRTGSTSFRLPKALAHSGKGKPVAKQTMTSRPGATMPAINASAMGSPWSSIFGEVNRCKISFPFSIPRSQASLRSSSWLFARMTAPILRNACGGRGAAIPAPTLRNACDRRGATATCMPQHGFPKSKKRKTTRSMLRRSALGAGAQGS